MMGEDIDELSIFLGDVTLSDSQSDDGKVEDEINVEREKVEKNVKANVDESNKFHRKEISAVEESIETDITTSNEAHQIELSDKKHNLKIQLDSLQCPFSWKFDLNNIPENVLLRTIEKIKEIEEVAVFQWRHFILTLVLCSEYYHKKYIDSAFAELKKCEIIIKNSDFKSYYEDFFQSTRNALLHVVLSCKCYLYLEKGDLNEVQAFLDKICKVEEMDSPCKAGIWGIKASVAMEYGFEGNKIALSYAKEALKIDDKQSEWHFILAKCLGRIRRVECYGDLPSQDEIEALEKAIRIAPENPSYVVFLAEVYREASKAAVVNWPNLRSREERIQFIEDMNRSSCELYRKSLEMQGECSHVNMRCAQGLYKLPPPYQDKSTAKKCCKKALEIAPGNPMAHQIMGYIYEREQDYKKAKRHFEKSGCFGALMDLHRLEYKLDKSYNPIPRFEHMLQQFVEKPLREEILCQMGSYYFFFKDDLATAFRKYWHEVIKEDKPSDKIKAHRSLFLYMKEPVNVYPLIYDEARLALKNINSISDEDVKLFQKIRCICIDLFPELDVESSPVPRHKIIFNEAINNSRHGHRNGRGRAEHRGRQRYRNNNQ